MNLLTDNEFAKVEARIKQLQRADLVRVFIKTGNHDVWQADGRVFSVGIHKVQPLHPYTSVIKTAEDFPLVSINELLFADVIEGDYVIGHKIIRAINYQQVDLE